MIPRYSPLSLLLTKNDEEPYSAGKGLFPFPLVGEGWDEGERPRLTPTCILPHKGGDGVPLGVRLPTLYATSPVIARSVIHRGAEKVQRHGSSQPQGLSTINKYILKYS